MMLRASALLVAFALALPGCDPVYDICVTVVVCNMPSRITGAHVRMPPYDFDDYTGPDGRVCYSDVGALGERFTIDVDKRGYQSKTAGPFQPENGSAHFDTEVCLEPTAPPAQDGGTSPDATSPDATSE
jgi:hypothetical protein